MSAALPVFLGMHFVRFLFDDSVSADDSQLAIIQKLSGASSPA
jgi:hypothetical protein